MRVVLLEEKHKERCWCVYIHTSLSGKKYIGITSKSLKERWGYNGNHYLRKDSNDNYIHPAMANALNKYKDWDNDWTHEIVYSNLTEEEANLMEVELIALYKTNCCRYNNPTYGYNCTDGGGGVSGRKASVETRQKISERAKERFLIPQNNPYYGKGEPVVQLSINGEFLAEYVSASEAAKVNGFWEGAIRTSCHSGLGHPYGYIWLFKKEYDPNKMYSPKNILLKAVVQLTKFGEFVAEYESVRMASDTTGIVAQSISNCCHGDIPSAGGFIWILKENYDPNKQYIWKSGTCTEIVQLTMNKELIAQYDSINQASHITGVGASAIGKCCSHKSNSSGGYIWMKLDEYKNNMNE